MSSSIATIEVKKPATRMFKRHLELYNADFQLTKRKDTTVFFINTKDFNGRAAYESMKPRAGMYEFRSWARASRARGLRNRLRRLLGKAPLSPIRLNDYM